MEIRSYLCLSLGLGILVLIALRRYFESGRVVSALVSSCAFLIVGLLRFSNPVQSAERLVFLLFGSFITMCCFLGGQNSEKIKPKGLPLWIVVKKP